MDAMSTWVSAAKLTGEVAEQPARLLVPVNAYQNLGLGMESSCHVVLGILTRGADKASLTCEGPITTYLRVEMNVDFILPIDGLATAAGVCQCLELGDSFFSS
jgi:hypothetical protein